MGISGISLLKAATGITVTAGTPAVFVDDGLDVKNGIHVVDTTVTSYLERLHATFKNKVPTLLPPGTYSKGKRDFNITFPKILADGSISFPVFRGSFEIHPEQSVSEILEMRLLACQAIMDAELDDYYVYGSVK